MIFHEFSPYIFEILIPSLIGARCIMYMISFRHVLFEAHLTRVYLLPQAIVILKQH